MIMAEISSTVSLSALATLPVGEEDSLKFSFEAVSGVGELSGNGPSSESFPIGPITPVASEGGISSLILAWPVPYYKC